MEWQPIETAPKKDNIDILVYRPTCEPNANIPEVGVDYYSTRLGGWAKSNHVHQPTHWMPLPKPPKP